MPPQTEIDSKLSDAASNGQLQRGLQRSEPKRLGLILVVVILLAGLTWFRHAADGPVMQGGVFLARLTLLAALAGYCLALLVWLRALNRRGDLVGAGFWRLTTVIEALVPSAALAILQGSDRGDTFALLSAPALLLYGVFIVLTVLRARPGLCLLSGLVAALGYYLLMAASMGTLVPGLQSGSWPYYLSYPLMLLITGVAAALVCFEVRGYFRAALREVQARHRLALLQHEVVIARSIQSQLMPEHDPDLPGFEIGGWSRPAAETAGDYHDWQALPDGRLAVAIADVSGHGIGPALLMAVCRAYTRAIVPGGDTLAAAMRKVNALLAKDIREGRFVTFAAAVLDGDSGRCELLSAGHAPIFYYHAEDGRIEEFGSQGIPLGIDAAHDYEPPQQLLMQPGDLLVLVTDGLYEQKRASDREAFGIERLRECIRQHASAPVRELIEHMDAAMQRFAAGNAQADDMTAVVIRRQRSQ